MLNIKSYSVSFLGMLLFFVLTDIILPQIRTNSRSRSVNSKQIPLLQKQLDQCGMKFGSKVFIRVFKESSELELWIYRGNEFSLFKKYRPCAHLGELGPKQSFDDNQTPEGFYIIYQTSLDPESKYHLSLDIGYPNSFDRYYNRSGSIIAIHGDCISSGCIAMGDENIEEIYTLAEAALRNGQDKIQVHIFPFYMTDENIQKYSESKWINFWKNLKEGYDIFKEEKIPVEPRVHKGIYIFKKSVINKR